MRGLGSLQFAKIGLKKRGGSLLVFFFFFFNCRIVALHLAFLASTALS